MKNYTLTTSANQTAVQTCQNVLRELIIKSGDYRVTPERFNSLVKAYYILESLPVKKISGYIDISANTHLMGGGLDYSSFTIGEDYFDIYTGFVKYDGGECDDSSWEKIYSSKDETHRAHLTKALECWAESFLLHLEENPARSLLIIDRSKLEGDEEVLAEISPEPKNITPNYAREPVVREYDEVPF